MTTVAPTPIPEQPDVDPVPNYHQPTRLAPRHPAGNPPGVSATFMAELGAISASTGMEVSAITGFLHHVQNVAIEVTLNSVVQLLRDIRRAQEARLNTIAQEVRALPPCPAPGGFLGGFNQQDQLIRQTYVSRDAVLAAIQRAITATPGA